MMEEEWKDIKGHEGYKVSNLGRVRNSDGRILAYNAISSGYLAVHLSKYHKKKNSSSISCRSIHPKSIQQRAGQSLRWKQT